MEMNPYQPPESEILVSSADANVEAIRREHLKHEASVKSVGTLYVLGGILVFIAGLGILLAPGQNGTNPIMIAGGFFMLLLAVGQFWVGLGLRKLKCWTRIPTAVVSGIGMLGFPLGTVINGYIMYLVLSKKGRMVLSDDYQQIIAQTPEIKYKSSILVLLLVVILIIAVVVGSIMAFTALSKH